MVGKSGKNPGEGYLLFGRTEDLSRPELVVLLTFVGGVATFDVVALLLSPGEDVPLRLLSIATTLTLALFAWSPPFAIMTFGVVVASAFAMGAPGTVLVGASVAALLVLRLASVPWVFAYIGTLILGTAVLIYREDVPTGSVAAFLALAIVAGAVGAGLRFSQARGSRLESQLVAQAEHERMAIQAERSWIAGELHDSIAHHLTVISLHSQMLDDEKMRPISQEAIEDASRKALADLRFIINISEDTPSGIDVPTGDLTDAIRDAKGELEAAGQGVIVEGDPAELSVPRGIEMILARMVRECATNIIKYAGPGEVRFVLNGSADEISLEVRSPRSAQTPRVSSSTGTGVSRMSERVLSQRGEFTAGPVGNEWVVFARLPISPIEDATGHHLPDTPSPKDR